MECAIAYLRVSNQRQQRSGLGIEAQRTTIQQFVANESLVISAEFVELESGKGADALDRRPQLAAALAAAKVAKCSVIVAKAGPAFPRCGLCRRSDGSASALRRCRT